MGLGWPMRWHWSHRETYRAEGIALSVLMESPEDQGGSALHLLGAPHPTQANGWIVPFSPTVRKQEIIKITEQLIEAINNGDFDAYT